MILKPGTTAVVIDTTDTEEVLEMLETMGILVHEHVEQVSPHVRTEHERAMDGATDGGRLG